LRSPGFCPVWPRGGSLRVGYVYYLMFFEWELVSVGSLGQGLYARFHGGKYGSMWGWRKCLVAYFSTPHAVRPIFKFCRGCHFFYPFLCPSLTFSSSALLRGADVSFFVDSPVRGLSPIMVLVLSLLYSPGSYTTLLNFAHSTWTLFRTFGPYPMRCFFVSTLYTPFEEVTFSISDLPVVYSSLVWFLGSVFLCCGVAYVKFIFSLDFFFLDAYRTFRGNVSSRWLDLQDI